MIHQLGDFTLVGGQRAPTVSGVPHRAWNVHRRVQRWLRLSWIVLVSGVNYAWAADPSPAPSRPSDWWSLKPLLSPAVPKLAGGEVPQNPIDSFIRARLAEKGLSPAPVASRRTLIRRLYFDLIGLPPRPADVLAFEADPDPQAYGHLVDRLLASPQYGERWARHWLDVVHYGETHGYDKDQPRPNAWPYRDYVIRSFNEDKPYARFVQEQVAGDVLFPGTRDGFEALGFVAAGPWDLIGHAEVPETKMDGRVARHLDRDDMVVNTIQTFNSLTVQCAQCHHHKFDPISMEDYYSLQAVFAAVDRADQKYDPDPEIGRTRKELQARLARLEEERQALQKRIEGRLGPGLAELDQKIATARSRPRDGRGYHSQIEPRADVAKWVQVDLGQSWPLQRIVLHPCKDDFNGIGEGFGFPVRYLVQVSNDPEFLNGVLAVADFTGANVPNPKLQAQTADAGGRSARYIRVTATQLVLRKDDYIFALAELDAVTADGRNVALGAKVTALDSIEAPPSWQKSNLTDGWFPGAKEADNLELSELQQRRTRWVAENTTGPEAEAFEKWNRQLGEINADLSRLPPLSVAYVAAVHKGSGAFTGTGGDGGKPRPIYLLNRGNVEKKGAEVGPGTLSCLPNLPTRFALPPGHPEAERRAALARWLTDSGNPLTWRSIVNRVWQYHFGRGLVETPNDFGRMGGIPSHPELLDWLASNFRDSGQSLKALHRQIVTSATYQQSSAVANSEAAALDGDNRLLWRQNRRKLEAEAVRDSVLAVSGKLNPAMGGPSFRDFVVEKPEHSPHYEYHLHDPEDPRSHRRSVYRFIVRSQQQPFMTVLDCADPSMQVGRRNEGLSPLQALALLNNSLMLTLSKHFAAHLADQGGDLATQVNRGHFEALGRPPTAEEVPELLTFARQHGLTNYCRVLLNLNEFTFVD